MKPGPFYRCLVLAAILGSYGQRSLYQPARADSQVSNQQIILKLKTHQAGSHDVLRQILPWPVRIDSLSPDDPDGPYLISLPKEISSEQARTRVSSDDRIEYAEPNYTMYAADNVPNDPFFTFMWQLHNKPLNEYVGKQGADVGALRAWDITTGNRDVVVAILDTGVELAHPDLAANAWINLREVPNNGRDDDKNGLVDDVNGWNFLHDNNRLFEDAEIDYHGTHIAGIIGAVGNNKIGTTGLAWRVSLMSLKVLDGHGNKGLISNSVKAINYVISQKKAGSNVRVINASWVNEEESLALRDAIEAAGRAGIVFICAAGNEAKNLDQDPIYPAARSADLDCLISVAATDRFDKLQPFSNYGRKTISVAAPGTDILGLAVGGQYAEHSGTSMATAHVSGIAVLMLAHDSSLTPAQIKRCIISTAEPIAGLSASCVGVGRAHAFNALTNTIPVIKIPVIGVVRTNDDMLIVDGLGFVKDLALIEVNGVALASTTYDSSYVRPTGKLTRLSANLGKAELETMFKLNVPVQISVYNPATKERSRPFVFVRVQSIAP